MKSTDYYIQTIANLVRAQGELADALTAKETENAELKAKVAELEKRETTKLDEPALPAPNGSTATFDDHGQATP